MSLYPLLPFSQLVYDASRWVPSIYRYGMTMRIAGGAKDEQKWREAIRKAIANHPVFSTRIDGRGHQYAAQTPDLFCGKYHHVSLRTDNDDLLISGWLNRILGDGKSLAIWMDDIRRAYNGEALEPDDYFGYLDYVEQLKHSRRYQESHDRLAEEFADESVPVRPTTDRRLWTLFPPKSGLYAEDYTALRKEIYRFAKSQFLTMEGFFSLCTALAIAEYCGTDAAALTWAYEGRERPEEQRIFGSLHRDIPFQIKNLKSKIINHKSDLIREARNQIRSGIANSDYPYTLTAPYNARWNYAVNVLRVEDEQELVRLLPQPVEVMSSAPQKYAYALLDVEFHESIERLEIMYRYSATHYKGESIRRFAALVRKYAEWLLEE